MAILFVGALLVSIIMVKWIAATIIGALMSIFLLIIGWLCNTH